MTRTRATTKAARAEANPSLLDVLPADLLEAIVVQLDADEFFGAASTCHAMSTLCSLPSLWKRVPLGVAEDPAFTPARRHLLHRLAGAGNATACYRLGVALSFHPTASAGDNDKGCALLRRLARQCDADDSLRADAAFECWLLTRRMPEPESPSSSDNDGSGSPIGIGSLLGSESLLDLAASLGHNPARFGKHRPRSRDREPDFSVSSEYATMQNFLRQALQLHPPNLNTASVCRSPSCGRWGVRARARANGVVGPPALPRCQGMMPGHCRARYCSRFCQAMDWPEHRLTCSLGHLPGGHLAHAPAAVAAPPATQPTAAAATTAAAS